MDALDSWFGTIPRGWRSGPIKADFAVQLGKMLQPSSRGVGDRPTPYLRAANVQWDGVRLGQGFLKSMYASESDRVHYAALAGDILVVEGGEGGRTCLLVEAIDGLIIQNSLLRLRPKDLSQIRSRFLIKVMIAANAAGYFAAANNGSTISHFTKVKCAVMPVPTPPDDVMNSIVRYLDHAELRIAKAIAAKQDVVRLLREQKAVVESGALFGGGWETGADPWFGGVPVAWSVLPARALFAERIERNQGTREMLSVTMARGVVKQATYLTSDGSKKDQTREDRSQYKAVEPNDLVYNKMRAWQGAAGKSPFRGIVSPAYVVLRPLSTANSDYYGMVLRSRQFAREAESRSYGITSDMWSLRPQHFKIIEFPCPPLAEQAAIVSACKAQTAKIDLAAETIDAEIALLKEYRIRLISDVVTGKLDVREQAANLPEIDPMELAVVSSTGAVNDEDEESSDVN